MAFFVVNYTYRADVDLDSVRPQHREFLGNLVDSGLLRASGPLVDVDPPAAVLIFEAGSIEEVADTLDADPFNDADFIEDTLITEWNPVIGDFAE
ncbi:MAG: YciI family protein [Mobilicoccus sp.]|nr:YciI family protein [Mobilicoccus sp.]